MIVQFQGVLGFGSRMSDTIAGGRTGINLKGHSFTTRFLVGVLQKAIYKTDPNTFQVFLLHMMQNFRSLYYDGICLGGTTLRFVVLGMKGDLPFLAKAGNLNRTFMNIRKAPRTAKSKPLTGCCWMCAAGTDAVPFEEFTTAPKWLATSGRQNALPWHCMPLFFDDVPHVVHDKGAFFKLDVLHIYHLGIGRDFVGSALTMALTTFYETSVEVALKEMNQELKQFLKASGKQVHFKTITRDVLGFTSEGVYPAGHWSKAMDTPVLMEFTSWIIQQRPNKLNESRDLQIICSACEAMSDLMRALLKAGLWLNSNEAGMCSDCGLHFLACYSKLANLSYQRSSCRFNLVPKLHCFHHICMDLRSQARTSNFALNPLSQCTFQDEDFVGRVARISRRVSPRLQSLRTIQRYLVATRQELQETK